MSDKPSWKDAPDWARYLARDADGDWYWYEYEPSPVYSMGQWIHSGRVSLAQESSDNEWMNSLEERP